RPTAFGCACIENMCDVRMVHQSQRLPLGLKTCDHAFGIHSRLNDFECDESPDRLLLFCNENHAAPSFPDFLQQSILIDSISGFFCSNADFASALADRPR